MSVGDGGWRRAQFSTVETSVRSEFSLADLVEAWSPYTDGLFLHDPEGPDECLVRSGELVVLAGSARRAEEHLRRWVDRTTAAEDGLPVVRFRLRAHGRTSCVDIARDTAVHVPGVAANHVHFGSPVMYGTPVVYGTGAQARSASPVPRPPEQRWNPQVTVGLLDTGLDPHPWFAGRPWFDDWDRTPEVLDADGDATEDRQASHGTFVAGVVLQHAPGVVIRPMRVLSSLGFTDDVRVAGGLRALRREAAARGDHVDVLLLTEGCYTAGNECPPVLRAGIERFSAAVAVAAAGNQRSTRPFWPAALPSVVGVAAVDADGQVAEYSNTGAWVDAAALGTDVVSSYVRLRPSGMNSLCGDADRSYGFATWSGTSFAAPAVAAEVALGLHRGEGVVAATRSALARYPFG